MQNSFAKQSYAVFLTKVLHLFLIKVLWFLIKVFAWIGPIPIPAYNSNQATGSFTIERSGKMETRGALCAVKYAVLHRFSRKLHKLH